MKSLAFSFLTALIALSSGIVRAQNSQFLVLDQISVPLENTTVTDSSAGGRLIYLATVDITLRENECLTVFQRLCGSLTENRALNFSIQSADMNGKITEERFYQNASIQEIVLPVQDAGSKDVITVQVKIRSASLSVKENSGTLNAGFKRSNALLASNFRVSLGGLPASRVAKIGAIRLSSGVSGFTIDVSGADAKSWKDWLLTSASKREAGAIEWLGPNFKDVLFRVELKDVEITSAASQYSAAATGRAIARLTVGLKGKVVVGSGK